MFSSEIETQEKINPTKGILLIPGDTVGDRWEEIKIKTLRAFGIYRNTYYH